VLLKTGGSICVPEFGGFGGTITYPPAYPSVKVQVSSGTTDYDHHRNLGGGPAMFYFQLSMTNTTTFERKFEAGGGLASAAFKPGETYTAYGGVMIASIPMKHKPCYVMAVKGKYRGLLGGLGKLTTNGEVPAPSSAFLETIPANSQRTNAEPAFDVITSPVMLAQAIMP
jgi:hypothetical protein